MSLFKEFNFRKFNYGNGNNGAFILFGSESNLLMSFNFSYFYLSVPDNIKQFYDFKIEIVWHKGRTLQ